MNVNHQPLVIRDSVHGDIIVREPVAIDLIDSKEFQRLRKIHQMSGARFVFPGATHTRFIHSLGVYHLISKIVNNQNFSQANLSAKAILKIKLAGLLHDIGHGPFSHTFEQIKFVNPNALGHEDYSALIITTPDSEINQILKKHGLSDIDISEIAGFIINKNHKNVLSCLVNSQIDADRMDYLSRDDSYSGTGYGYTDIDYLIRHMNLDQDQHKITFNPKAIFSIENYLIGRYHMYLQVYHHPISVGYDLLFRMWCQRLYDLHHIQFAFQSKRWKGIIKALCQCDPIDYKTYVSLDDYSFSWLIKDMTSEADPILRFLSNSLNHRNVFREVSTEQEWLTAQQAIKNQYGSEAVQYFTIKIPDTTLQVYHSDTKPIWIKTKTGIKNFKDCSKLVGQIPSNNYNQRFIYFIIKVRI